MSTYQRNGRLPSVRLADREQAGRSAVRRRARGMTHRDVTDALERARLDHRQDLRYEALADDGGRAAAEVAEWARIAQLLAEVGGVYDPRADAAVQDEQRAWAAHDAAHRAAREHWQQTVERADALERLARKGRLPAAGPGAGDEAARNLLAQRGSWRIPAVDAWLAHALAARLGHYSDPAARAAAAETLPPALTAHAALLSALALADPTAGGDRMPFAGLLAQADPDATAQLAAFLDHALAAQPDPTPSGEE